MDQLDDEVVSMIGEFFFEQVRTSALFCAYHPSAFLMYSVNSLTKVHSEELCPYKVDVRATWTGLVFSLERNYATAVQYVQATPE